MWEEHCVSLLRCSGTQFNDGFFYSIQLIERFYDPLIGQVLLDGEPINEYNVQEYRKQIALVSQEPVCHNKCDHGSRVANFRNFRLFTLAPFVSTFYLVQLSQYRKSLKRRSRQHAEMPTFSNLSGHCQSKAEFDLGLDRS